MGTQTTFRTTWTRAAAGLAALLAAGAPAQEAALRPPTDRFGVDILVDGVPRPRYPARGTVYFEALRGREYTIRLANPLPVRVAVALSVDGLNTIDAATTSAWKAAKWVLGPYETAEIPGWQVNGETARRFVFTGEGSSYGAWLGQTENLGVIEAVFFRERSGWVGIDPLMEKRTAPGEGAGAPAPQASAVGKALDDDYAATGMGERQEHRVRHVHLRLERDPVAVVRLRYEFRPELERLGVLLPRRSPLERRERARGFPGYCPEPPRW